MFKTVPYPLTTPAGVYICHNSTAPGIVVIQDAESIYHQQDTAETAAG